MGLDVYLRKYKDFDATERRTAEYEVRANKVCEEIKGEDDASKAKRSAARKEIAAELGLSEWGEDEGGVERIEKPSASHPEHLFKVGYFRSSYNEGGINRKLRNLGLPELDDIMGHEGQEYYQVLDRAGWQTAKDAALETREKWLASPPYGITTFRGNPYVDPKSLPKDEETALRIGTKKLTESLAQPRDADMRAFGCQEGDYWLDGFTIFAVIPGIGWRGERVIYAVFEDKHRESYAQSLEIVAETCDYVLGHTDEEIAKFRLCWSG